jgi:HK97 family phage prohead protease
MTKKIEDYRKLPNFETKRVPTFIKQTDESQGIVEHFVAIMGNLDEGKDVIDMGAFRKSLAERKNRIRVLDQHQTDSVLRVIGKPLDIREVGRDELTAEVLEYAPDAEGGLLATTQYAVRTDNGRNVFELIKGGFADESSIGYDAVQVHHEDVLIDGKKVTVRRLKEIRLWEYSNVIFGMNQATAVVSAKEDPPLTEKPEIKTVTPYQNLDLGDREEAWDGDQVRLRLREWAGGVNDMDWDKYQKGFFWRESGEPELFQSYKLPYADVVDGELVAIPRGIFAVAGSIQGARGTPPDIPANDIERIKNNVDRYYAKMRSEFEDDSLIAPWNKEAEAEPEVKDDEVAVETETEVTAIADEKVSDEYPFAISFNLPEGVTEEGVIGFKETIEAALQAIAPPPKETEVKDDKMMGTSRLGDVLQGNLHYVFTCLVDKWYIRGTMNREERMLLSSLIGNALDVLELGMPEDLASRDVSHGPLYANSYGYDFYGLEPDLEGKAGRILSARNAQKIQAALANLHEVLMEAGMLVTEPDEAGSVHEEDEEDKGKDVVTETPTQSEIQDPKQDDAELLQLLELEEQEISMLNLF